MSDSISHGSTSTSESTEAERMLAEALALPVPEREARIDKLCAERPAHAPELRELWRQFCALEGVGVFRGMVGDVLGDFRILRRIGEGGMGFVFLAEQMSLSRRVALKVIRPELMLSDRSRERFRREARAIAKLSHPNIVPVYAYDEQDGVAYLAMDWVDGASLGEAIARLRASGERHLRASDLADAVGAGRGAQAELFCGTWAESCARIGAAVGDALEHAHARGIVHRDVKPSNIMIARDGRVLLLDFGLARTPGDARLTRSGTQPGSLAYMSPEQVASNEHGLGPASDVYSLGVTLFESLALDVPFRASSPPSLIQKILEVDAPRLRSVDSSVPPDLDAIVALSLEKRAARRFASAADLAADLRRFLAGEPVRARPSGVLRRGLRRVAANSARIAWACILCALVAWGLHALLAWREAQVLEAEQRAQARVARAFEALGSDEARASLQAVLAEDPARPEAVAGLVLGALERSGAPAARAELARWDAVFRAEPELECVRRATLSEGSGEGSGPAAPSAAGPLACWLRAQLLMPRVRSGSSEAIGAALDSLRRARAQRGGARFLLELTRGHVLQFARGARFVDEARECVRELRASWGRDGDARALAERLELLQGGALSGDAIRARLDGVESALELLQSGQHRAALDALVAQRADSADAPAFALELSARAYRRAGMLERSDACLATIVARAPADFGVWRARVEAMRDAGRLGRALALCEAALKVGRDSSILALDARCAFEAQRLTRARRSLEELLNRQPDEREARALYADCLLEMGFSFQAFEQAQRLLGSGPRDPELVATAAAAAAQIGLRIHEPAHATRLTAEARALPLDTMGSSAIARVASAVRVADGEEEALAILERARALRSGADVVLDTAYARQLTRCGRFDHAREMLERAVHGASEKLHWQYGLVQIFRIEHDALRDRIDALEVEHAKKSKRAKQSKRRRSRDRLHKEVRALRRELGELRERQVSLAEQALVWLQKLVAVDTHRERVLAWTGDFNRDLRRHRENIELMRAAIQNGIESASICYRLGTSLMWLPRVDPMHGNNAPIPSLSWRRDRALSAEAYTQFELALQLDPLHAASRYRRASCLRRLGYVSEAEECVRALLLPLRSYAFIRRETLDAWGRNELRACRLDREYEYSFGRWLQILTIGLARSFSSAGEYKLAATTWTRLWREADYAFLALDGDDLRMEAAHDLLMAVTAEREAFTPAQRALLREQARYWVEQRLKMFAPLLADRARRAGLLALLQRDAAFAGFAHVRGRALESLPAAERAAWRETWTLWEKLVQ